MSLWVEKVAQKKATYELEVMSWHLRSLVITEFPSYIHRAYIIAHNHLQPCFQRI